MEVLVVSALFPPLLYVLAAVLPAAFLLVYVYCHDRVEREPVGLLAALLGRGVLAAVCAVVLEIAAQILLDRLITPGSVLHTVLEAFLVVAAVEEGTKYFFLKRRTWNDPNFNYRFDAIVYAVFVSLGFAAFENIQYVFAYGLSVVLPRALLSVPGHMSFGVYIGIYYGRARFRESYGHPIAAKRDRIMAYVSAVMLHGFYDACAMIGTPKAAVVFIIFVVVTYLNVFHRLRKESARDIPV